MQMMLGVDRHLLIVLSVQLCTARWASGRETASRVVCLPASAETRDSPFNPDVKIENRGSGQYGAEPHYSTLPFWQLCALKG